MELPIFLTIEFIKEVRRGNVDPIKNVGGNRNKKMPNEVTYMFE